MPRRLLCASLAAIALAVSMLATPARAQTWAEVGDAGSTPGGQQTPIGLGPLTQITGTLTDGGDVDLYCLEILNHTIFNASLFCLAQQDPSIWLFHFTGQGIAHNDLCVGAGKTIPASSIASIGTYYLAVAAQGMQAISPGGSMWQTGLFVGPRPVDGPGAAGNLNGWGGIPSPSSLYNYTVNLQGASFCGTAVPVRGGTWGRLKVLYR